MRVVQLLPALQVGGAERTTLEVARALARAGHESHVISAGGALVARLQDEGSAHHALAVGEKSWRAALRARALRSLLMELQADIVHVRSRLPAWLLRRALRGMAKPPHVVSTVHGLNSPGRYSGVLLRAERVVCVSGTVRAHVLRHWPDIDPGRVRVIAPGIDPAEFPFGHAADPEWLQSQCRQWPALRTRHRLLLPGRAGYRKGHAEAIALLAALRGDGLDVALWCPGSGETARELERLDALARAAGVREACVFAPALARMADAYAASDLVLQLSHAAEAFGRSVQEAFAIGRPVLGWDQGGVGEQLRAHLAEGAIAAGDASALRVQARSWLEAPPALPPGLATPLSYAMAAHLALYDGLVRSPGAD
jgi:glycosyltransferase involved in cell wall biosynthesis